MIWTNEATDRLCAMWADGHSQAAIAAELGSTVGAVSGKIGRMNLTRRGPSHAALMARQAAERAAERRKSIKPPQHIPAKKARHSKPVPLWERTGCAYPVNDPPGYLFCNAASAPGGYCEFHRKLMYRAPV